VRLLIRLAINTVAIVVAAYVLPALSVESWKSAVVAGLLLGLLNTFVRPIFRLLTLPINVATLGLFVVVTNALILVILDWLMPGLKIDGFLWAIVTAVIIAVITTVVNILVGDDDKRSAKRSRR
jgi:putative membrane protein